MKKSIFMTLAAVVVCGLALTLFTQCNKDKNKNPEVKMMYYVSVSPDVLSVADVEINYLDATGAQQKEILTDTAWKKPLETNTLPLTEGVWAKLTPKASITDGNYQLSLRTVAAYDAILSDGTNAHDGWENVNSDITIAQNAEEIAAWCAQIPAVAIAIDKEGSSEITQVDFGGNYDYDPSGYKSTLCVGWCWLFGYDPEERCEKW
ncbi:MAG: hypothetical protein II887_03320 [Bacteroidales bacterium]|nr:hypothetical protein [Bacteroidales bacterium]